MSISRKRAGLFATATIVLALAGTFAAIRVDAGPGDAPAGAPPAASVDVAPALGRTITDWQVYSGRLEAVDDVQIRPLVSGTITAVYFRDGSLVHKGDPLFTIDPRPYAADVAKAQAQLAAASARAAYTAADLTRAQHLLSDDAIAKRDFDEKQNAAREAAANALAADAALSTARLYLGYTRIVAPVDGRVSRAEMTVGNVVAAGAGSAPLTRLVSVARVYASFNVDEQSFLQYISPSATSHRAIPVYLGLANEDGYSRQGTVESVDNRLDTTSGTIRVRAVFDNPDGALVPGLYARLRVGGSAPHPAVLIDDKAIGTDQDKKFVMVVDAGNHVAYREVSLGASQDGLRVVKHGLNAGELVVVNGLQRVRPGDSVKPNAVPMNGVAATAGNGAVSTGSTGTTGVTGSGGTASATSNTASKTSSTASAAAQS